MSVQAISAALAIQTCSSAEKFLLIVLANYADHTMRCWPSQARLASDMSVSERHMQRLFIGLQGKGLVSRERRPRRFDGTRTSALITLHLQQDTMSSGPLNPQDIHDTINRTPCPEQQDTMSSKPSENHQEEPSARECAQGLDEEDLKKEVLAWADRFTKGSRR